MQLKKQIAINHTLFQYKKREREGKKGGKFKS